MNMGPMRRHLLHTSFGYIHARDVGEGPPIVLLHQTADSSREFLALMKRLSICRRVVALDTLGYGDSDATPRRLKMREFASCAAEALAMLGIADAAVLGNHTGASIAIELALVSPNSVRALVLNGVTLWNDQQRAEMRQKLYVPILPVEDGSHLALAWRRAHYMSELPLHIVQRGVVDILKAPDPLAAYHAVFEYDPAPRLPLLECPVLVIAGEHDPLSRLSVRAASLCRKGYARTIPGARFYLADLHTETYADAILHFLAESDNLDELKTPADRIRIVHAT